MVRDIQWVRAGERSQKGPGTPAPGSKAVLPAWLAPSGTAASKPLVALLLGFSLLGVNHSGVRMSVGCSCCCMSQGMDRELLLGHDGWGSRSPPSSWRQSWDGDEGTALLLLPHLHFPWLLSWQ